MTGLTHQQVLERKKKGLDNHVTADTGKSRREIIHENVFTYFNLIFLILGILLFIAGAYNSMTFLPVVFANILIGTIQELHAKKVLDGLAILHAPRCTVVRDGRQESVPVEELVQDDVIVLTSGCEIPADAKVIAGEISVNEAMLTGETDEIKKIPGKPLLSGSFVVSGSCQAVLTAVGDASYAARLSKRAKSMKTSEESEMIRAINRLVKVAGILIIPIFVCLMAEEMILSGHTFAESIEGSVAAVIGMIPEGLYLLVSVTLAASAVRLSQNKVMLHDMKSIETLARVNVLCVDKTGTITEPDMKVRAVYGPREGDDTVRERRLLADYIQAVPDNNSTMKALREAFPNHSPKAAKAVSPFSSALKYSRVLMRDDIVYTLGAPDVLLKDDEQQRQRTTPWVEQGYRVLLFGRTSDPVIYEDGLHGTVTPLLYILLENPIRANAPAMFRYFHSRKVAVKVISGDNPVTVSKAARKAGVAHADHYVDCRTLTSDAQLADALNRYAVFGRTTPEQKQKMVELLKKAGRTVAMTGDGVNDILAMKKADCSIAMASGSDAAVQAAQVVLLDSDFGHMRMIISEGRRVVNNIQRSASLFLVKNLFSLMLAVFSILHMTSYPLVPSQISLISMFNIGIPGFLLALEPNEEPIPRGFMPKVISQALPGALTDYFLIIALVQFAVEFNISEGDVSVTSAYLMALTGFYVLYRISRPLNGYRRGVLIGCVLGFLFSAYFFSDLFSISRISYHASMLCFVFALASFTVFFLFDNLFASMAALFRKMRKKLSAKRKANRKRA